MKWASERGNKGDFSDFECSEHDHWLQVWAFHTRLVYWDFHDIIATVPNSPKKRKCEENVVRGQRGQNHSGLLPKRCYLSFLFCFNRCSEMLCVPPLLIQIRLALCTRGRSFRGRELSAARSSSFSLPFSPPVAPVIDPTPSPSCLLSRWILSAVQTVRGFGAAYELGNVTHSLRSNNGWNVWLDWP